LFFDKDNRSYITLLRNFKKKKTHTHTQIGIIINSNAKGADKLNRFRIVIQLGPKPHWFIEGERMQFIQGEIRHVCRSIRPS